VNYKRGDIVWVKFPFSDASSAKLRPALIISNDIVNTTGDFLLMQITTRLRRDGLSQIILQQDYKEDPLLKQSELRLHKIFIIHHSLIANKITSVNQLFLNNIITKLLSLLS
jgi:mRNA interferase MazF